MAITAFVQRALYRRHLKVRFKIIKKEETPLLKSDKQQRGFLPIMKKKPLHIKYAGHGFVAAKVFVTNWYRII